MAGSERMRTAFAAISIQDPARPGPVNAAITVVEEAGGDLLNVVGFFKSGMTYCVPIVFQVPESVFEETVKAVEAVR